jgi:hypothetical protein
MTLFPRPILTNGATHPASQFRMLVRDLARGAEGITEGDDLKVTQRSTPGGGITVADGSGVIQGRDDAFQGHYSACNVGAVDVDIASTGGTGRSDMVILRIEDPEYTGDLDPETDQIAYFQVISNVSSSATAIPDGRTGIPLARIDIPSSTATITNAMITDLRKVANPRRERTRYLYSPASLSEFSGDGTWRTLGGSGAPWSIPVPSWATKAIISVDGSSIRLSTNPIFGQFRFLFGASLTGQSVNLDDNQTGVRRITGMTADTLTLPAAYRGTNQTLTAQFVGQTGYGGKIGYDGATTILADVEFVESPR